MEAQTIYIPTDQYHQSNNNAQFFVFTGSLEPPFVTIQDNTGDGESVMQHFYARPVIYDKRRGVCVIIRFATPEQAGGRTFHISLYQKGLQTHPEVSPYED